MTEHHLGETGVYRLFDAHDRLLYVGIGSVPESRWRDHAKNKAWWPDVTRKTVTWWPTYSAAQNEEARAIDDEHPLHNRRPGVRVPESAPSSDVRVPLDVVRAQFGRRVDAAHYSGDITVITKNGEERAALVPIGELRRLQEADSRS